MVIMQSRYKSLVTKKFEVLNSVSINLEVVSIAWISEEHAASNEELPATTDEHKNTPDSMNRECFYNNDIRYDIKSSHSKFIS
ncbi:MAG: hypothetical protein JEZ08_09860 [Clostridiales bacterium]|nr:hypothetical protein [Clostridiales bacterium]